MDDGLAYLGATELVAGYRDGALSPVDAIAEALARIERFEPVLNAFTLVDGDGARARARESEARWRDGAPMGALDGVPMTLKDIVLIKGWPTLEGSRTTDPERDWNEDCPAVARLREAGAIFLGKTTTPEFGWKGMTDSPLSGITRNPWNPDLTPGGSSGGAGAALAAGIGALAFGTDGGGSIRIPASYCGLYGIKPTFGRVPHYPQESPFAGVVCGGPLARSVADAALMLNVISRPDARDGFALPPDGRDWRDGLDDGVAGLRLAYAPALGGAEAAPDVLSVVAEAVRVFTGLGAHVEEVGPVFDPPRPQFEAYWLAGFAHRLRAIPPAKRDLMDPGLRALAEHGLAVSIEDYCAAMAARARLAARMSALHEDFDLLLTPTMPTPPPPVDMPYHSPGFDRWRHAVPFTVPFNLTGQPAASIPCGVCASGMPVGLQIVGPRFGEALVLRASRAFEAALARPYPRPVLAALAGASPTVSSY